MKFRVFSILFALGLLSSQRMTWAEAFLYSNGVFTTFEVPGALPGSTQPNSINNRGQIVGEFVDSTGQLRAFLDTNGVFTMPNLPGIPTTINDLGQMAGLFFNGTGTSSFLYANGVVSTFNFPGAGYTYARSLNNQGQIVGLYADSPTSGNLKSFLYNNGVLTNYDVPGAFATYVVGINNRGQILGSYFNSVPGTSHEYIETNGIITELNLPFGMSGFNDLGQIVGNSGDLGYLYTNGVITPLQSPNYSGTRPLAINNAGQIVGYATPAPEPASLLLCAGGLAVVGFLLRRKYARVADRGNGI